MFVGVCSIFREDNSTFSPPLSLSLSSLLPLSPQIPPNVFLTFDRLWRRSVLYSLPKTWQQHNSSRGRNNNDYTATTTLTAADQLWARITSYPPPPLAHYSSLSEKEKGKKKKRFPAENCCQTTRAQRSEQQKQHRRQKTDKTFPIRGKAERRYPPGAEGICRAAGCIERQISLTRAPHISCNFLWWLFRAPCPCGHAKFIINVFPSSFALDILFLHNLSAHPSYLAVSQPPLS